MMVNKLRDVVVAGLEAVASVVTVWALVVRGNVVAVPRPVRFAVAAIQLHLLAS